MATSPISTTTPRRRRTGLEEALAERDALAAEVTLGRIWAAVRNAPQASATASSEPERQAAAQYRQLVGALRSAERTADHAWRRFCRILDER